MILGHDPIYIIVVFLGVLTIVIGAFAIIMFVMLRKLSGIHANTTGPLQVSVVDVDTDKLIVFRQISTGIDKQSTDPDLRAVRPNTTGLTTHFPDNALASSESVPRVQSEPVSVLASDYFQYRRQLTSRVRPVGN